MTVHIVFPVRWALGSACCLQSCLRGHTETGVDEGAARAATQPCLDAQIAQTTTEPALTREEN